MFSAIVLSAGKSERMGRPKALLPYRDSTFLDTILLRVSESSLEGATVVLGHHRDQILAECRPPRWVENPRYEEGMTTSFQAGIRAMPPGCRGAMLFLVDHPEIPVRVIQDLIAAFRPGSIVIPTFGDRRGHPVLFSREVWGEILDLPPTVGANQVVRRKPDRVIHLPVEDQGVLADVDTPGQYRRMRHPGSE